uniref:Uncharacterized LOC100179330 n=1 Tax=Ciona intestinalis TaxID=7719 RepID=F6R868_CIOIN|nr:uncharacterized protein LOC100179330 isoform X1 [Ciona intestinalis]|eukprot:XP_002128977.1 uncharacterized protein LOC100179330 isoform X1 [Ciona intestinalis]
MKLILCFLLSLLEPVFMLTQREFTILNENSHGSVIEGAFVIEEDYDDAGVAVYKISITGYPQHATADCYMSQLDCCRSNVEPVESPASMTIYRDVEMTENVYCTPLGTVGMSTGGTHFYNHLESECANVNIMVDGTFDECNGHTGNNIYHFHRAPNPDCVGGSTPGPHIIGVSLDGFAVYNSDKYKGVTQDLDECGGFAPEGDPTKYRYVAQYGSGDEQGTDFVIPCFRAVPYENACCACNECDRVTLPNCNRRGKRSFKPEYHSYMFNSWRTDKHIARRSVEQCKGSDLRTWRAEFTDAISCDLCTITCVPTGGFTNWEDTKLYNRCKTCT